MLQKCYNNWESIAEKAEGQLEFSYTLDMVPGSKLSLPRVKVDQDSGLLIYFQMLTCGKDALAASFDLAHIKGLFWKLKGGGCEWRIM